MNKDFKAIIEDQTDDALIVSVDPFGDYIWIEALCEEIGETAFFGFTAEQVIKLRGALTEALECLNTEEEG